MRFGRVEVLIEEYQLPYCNRMVSIRMRCKGQERRAELVLR